MVAALALAGCSGGTTLVYSSTPVPTATPATLPSTAPTASPLSLSPAALNFSALGAAATLPFTVTEAGYTGGFTAVSEAPGIASVASIVGSTGSFGVTPLAGGSTTILVSDQHGQTAQVGIAVTTATFVPQ